MLKRSIQLLVVVSVALVLLLSCAPAKEVTPTPVAPTPVAPPPAVPTPTAPVVTPTPEVGLLRGTPEGTLRVALGAFGQESWNPLVASTVSRNINIYLLENLVGLDQYTIQYLPGLATEWSTTDAIVWEFKLREGVKFSDGTEFTATDAKFSIEVHSNYSTGSSVGMTMKAILLGVDIIGRYEIRVRLSQPTPLLPQYFCQIEGLWMVPAKSEDAIVKGTFDENPIGTGPFRLVKHTTASLIRYEAVSEHWRIVPDYKTLDLLLVPEIATQVAMLKTGEVDVAGIGPANIEDVKAAGFRVVTIQNNPLFILASFGGNWLPERENYQADNPLLKKEFRMAINHAINREELAETLFYGLATPANIPLISKGTVGWIDWPVYKYDPAYSRQLIQQAGGWPEGKVIKVISFDKAAVPMLSETMEVIGGYLDAVGIPTRITPMEPSLCTNYYKGRAAEAVGAIWPQVGSFYPAQDKRGGSYWMSTGSIGLFESPEVDRLIKASTTAIDPDERQRTAQAAYQFHYDNHSAIPLVNYPMIVAISDKVEEFTEICGDELTFMEYVKIKH